MAAAAFTDSCWPAMERTSDPYSSGGRPRASRSSGSGPPSSMSRARTGSARPRCASAPWIPGTLPVGVDLGDELGEHDRRALVAHLARAGRVVAAAAVAQHQLAHVGRARAVEDRLARGEDRVLLAQAPE